MLILICHLMTRPQSNNSARSIRRGGLGATFAYRFN